MIDKQTYVAWLEADYRRLRQVAAGRLDAKVPTCPEWTVTDLVRHVAMVYVDKTEIMRTGTEQKWPPELTADPLPALDQAYAGLVAELTAREPDEPAPDWFKPDRTVGFMIRRMPLETVIHRVDAELAAGAEIAPIPTGLALDGIDEVLERFLSYCSHEWPDYMGDTLTGADGRAVTVDAGSDRWTVRITPAGADVTRGDGPSAARVAGPPAELLLWLWRRSENEAITKDGDEKLVARLWDLLGATTV